MLSCDKWDILSSINIKFIISPLVTAWSDWRCTFMLFWSSTTQYCRKYVIKRHPSGARRPYITTQLKWTAVACLSETFQAKVKHVASWCYRTRASACQSSSTTTKKWRQVASYISVQPTLATATYNELNFDKEVSFEEFFIFWYHFIYTETTDILIAKNIVQKPQDEMFYYQVAVNF